MPQAHARGIHHVCGQGAGKPNYAANPFLNNQQNVPIQFRKQCSSLCQRNKWVTDRSHPLDPCSRVDGVTEPLVTTCLDPRAGLLPDRHRALHLLRLLRRAHRHAAVPTPSACRALSALPLAGAATCQGARARAFTAAFGFRAHNVTVRCVGQ